MGTEKEQGNVLELVIIGVLVLVIAGFVVWRFVGGGDNDTASKKSESSSTAQPASGSTQTETSDASYLKVSQWGVKFAISDSIKSASYTHDTSNAVFPGEVIRITSITDANGKEFALFDVNNSSADATSVDAICSTYGLGRSTNSSETNPSSGTAYTMVAHVGDYYYYSLNGVAGASCGQSEGATAAVQAVMDMFKKPLTN